MKQPPPRRLRAARPKRALPAPSASLITAAASVFPTLQHLESRLLLALTPIGSEFRANTFTAQDQKYASVAMDSAGDSVIAWASYGQDGAGAGVYAQRYNAAGAAVGSEFRVNAFTTSDQTRPSVAMDAAGDFVIAWSSFTQDGSADGIYARRYNAAGAAAGGEFHVTTTTANDQKFPSLAMDRDGDFIIAWQSFAQDGDAWGIYAQRYTSAGLAVGSEFRVNTFTTFDQTNPSVATDATGDFVIAWDSYGQDGVGWSIYAQRYNSAGAAAGDEFRVNTYTTDDQTNNSVAMDSSGDFVIAWQSTAQDGPGLSIHAQRYNAAGAALRGEFAVNTSAADQSNPSIAMNAAGHFLIAWQSITQDGSNLGIYAQRYNSDAYAVGGAVHVNTHASNAQANPAVAIDASGDVLVAWQSLAQDGNGYGVYAQRYRIPLPPAAGPEFRANTYTTNNQQTPSVAIDAAGDFVVAWASSDDFGIYAQRYNAAGAAVGAEFRVNTFTDGTERNPSLAMDAAGDFVIAWNSYGQEGQDYEIYAQRYNAAGAAVGGEFHVNTVSDGDQYAPSVAMDAAGNFVIAWQSPPQNAAGLDIYARRYSAAGAALGGQFLVNTFTTGIQNDVSVAMDAAGDFVVAWNSNQQDGSNFGVYAQRYSAAAVAQGAEFRVNTYTADEQRKSSIAMDANGDFVVAWQSHFQDGDANGIYAQRYSAAGVALGAEFRVNTTTPSYQEKPSVAMDAAGDFVVTWQSYGQDGSNTGVYAQRYDATGAPIGEEFRVNTYTEKDQNRPAIAMNPHGDYLIAWQSSQQDGSAYGIYAQRYHQPTGAVSGKLFNDKNGNRRKDSTDPGLFRWRVFIDTDNDGKWDKNETSVLTDRAGNWKLSNIPFGTRRIRLVLKRGWKHTTPRNRVLAVTLTTTQSSLTNRLFGLKRI